MKKISIIVISLLISCLLGGCSKNNTSEKYTETDAQTYLQDRYGGNFSYNSTAEANNSTLYSFTADDEFNSTVTVMVKVSSGLLGCLSGCSYTMKDDYNDVFVYHLATQILKNDDKSYYSINGNSQLELSFSSYDQIDQRFKEAYEIFPVMQSRLHGNMSLRISIRYENPEVNTDASAFNIQTFIESSLADAVQIKDIQTEYTMMVGSYRLSDSTIPDTILAALPQTDYVISVKSNSTSFDYASSYTDKVTFGILYDILSQQGFTIEGTPLHFKLEQNGDIYEFSYLFLDPVTNNEYYLKNHEQVRAMFFYVPAFLDYTFSN